MVPERQFRKFQYASIKRSERRNPLAVSISSPPVSNDCPLKLFQYQLSGRKSGSPLSDFKSQPKTHKQTSFLSFSPHAFETIETRFSDVFRQCSHHTGNQRAREGTQRRHRQQAQSQLFCPFAEPSDPFSTRFAQELDSAHTQLVSEL